MFTKAFALALLERAIKTLAQAAVAAIVAAGTGLIGTDWLGILSVAGMAAVISVLTSIASGAVSNGTPSLGSAEVIPVEPTADELAAVAAATPYVEPDEVPADVIADPGSLEPPDHAIPGLDDDADDSGAIPATPEHAEGDV